MGILDDAIREHLELKRKHGAESSDVERLEQEAFGPATRPGDPEFATGEEPVGDQPARELGAGSRAAGSSAGGAAAADIPDWLIGEEETTVAPSAPPSQEGGSDSEEPYVEVASEQDVPPGAAGDSAVAREAPVLPPDGPVGDDVAASVGVGEGAEQRPTQLGPADEAEPPPEAPSPSSEPDSAGAPAPEEQAAIEHELPAEPEPPEAPERGIFDAEALDFGELDLELDDEEELEDEPFLAAPDPTLEPPAAEPPASVRESGAPRRAVAPFETDPDLPPAPLTPAEPAQEAITPAGQDAEAAESSDDDEDLLEETPDFLQDAPEGEDLWFEQGPPRDFDFDDD